MIKIAGISLQRLMILTSMLLSACTSVPVEHFFLHGNITDSVSPPSSSVGDARSHYSILVGPVTVPELVDRSQLVIRTTAHRVNILDNHRWAESLRTSIARVLANNIGQRLDGAATSVYRDNASRDARYRVAVDITRFESRLNDAIDIEAQWSIRNQDGELLRRGKSVTREQSRGATVEDLVAAHERALTNISGDMAEAIRVLNTPEHGR